jgi:hypothetical protein
MGERAAQPELEAGAHVIGRPVGLAIGPYRVERRGEGAIGIGRARPHVALVQMRVQIDQSRPDLSPVLIDQAGTFRRWPAARRLIPADPAVLDVKVDQREPVAGIGEVALEQAERHARAGDAQVRAFGQG